MNKPFSVYLDLVRFTAACLVYLYHSNQRWLTTDILPASNFGHSSVIVFFVLSGFVIAYITDKKERQFATYAASRLSRVYSVAIPAILLTVLLDAVGRHLLPGIYSYPFDNFLLRVGASTLLLNEVWFVSVTSFSNVPYWSICYEMWYYVSFGLLMFLPKRFALLSVAMLMVILGPKIVLLAPIWVLGVVLYRWDALPKLPATAYWLLLFFSTAGILAFHYFKVSEWATELLKSVIGAKWHTELTFSKFFVGDYLLGILVFVNFAAMRTCSPTLAPAILVFERPIRFLAGYTLSLYLLHQPLFLFWGAVLRGDPNGQAFWWLTTGLVAVSVFAVGQLTETRRHLLKTFLEEKLVRLETYVRQNYASQR